MTDNWAINHDNASAPHRKDPAYGFNRLLGGFRKSDVKRPHETVLLFDSNPGLNPTGGPELLPDPGRHSDGSDVVLFVDGHYKRLQPAEARRANFDPNR